MNFSIVQCKWCPEAERCSSGYDRHRQDWQWKQCEVTSVGGPNATACADAKLYKQLKPSLDGSSNHQMSIISGDPHPQVATVIQDSSEMSKFTIGSRYRMTLTLALLSLKRDRQPSIGPVPTGRRSPYRGAAVSCCWTFLAERPAADCACADPGKNGNSPL
ncbi:unnamed protein product [Nesidiocoris tenuis]|uniref:Uncharacterized protein n=1 Tax=Nesidiocoris tenuis TaxID=355587 RepID=A0A6H5G1Z2_9HEMI|nr:unnamed protein product [Nesidiocoris tenuis]